MFILFLAFLGALQIVNSGLFSVAQSNIVSNCFFSMSVDNIWLAETCTVNTNIYKFNGTAFNKLSYTIPLASKGCQISVNSYGSFIAQAIGSNIIVYKINDTLATLAFNKTYSSCNSIVIDIATNGTFMTIGLWNNTGSTSMIVAFLKYNGTTYINYGSNNTFLNAVGRPFNMSQMGTMMAIYVGAFDTSAKYLRFFNNTGSGFSQISSTSISEYYIMAISPSGSYYARLQLISGTYNIIFYTYNNIPYPNATAPYPNVTTGIPNGTALSIKFLRNGLTDYLYLINSNQSVRIYQNTGSNFTLVDTVNMAFNSNDVEFSSALTYFYLNNPSTIGNTYLYVYCNVANCQTCQTPGQCGTCLVGYSLSNNACGASKLITQQSADTNSSTPNTAIFIGGGVVTVIFFVGLILLLIKIKNVFAAKNACSDPKAVEFNDIKKDSKIGQNLIEESIQ